jgi:hypothetical protein
MEYLVKTFMEAMSLKAQANSYGNCEVTVTNQPNGWYKVIIRRILD